LISWKCEFTNKTKYGAVNLRKYKKKKKADFTERGGTNPNPPHGGPPYPFHAECTPEVKDIDMYVPQIQIKGGGPTTGAGSNYYDKKLDLLISIVRVGPDNKPYFFEKYMTKSKSFYVDIIEYADSTGKTHAVAVNPHPKKSS